MGYYSSILIRNLKKKDFLALIGNLKKFGSSVEQVEKDLIIFSNGDIRIINCIFKLKEIYKELRVGLSQYIGLAKGLSKIAQFGEILISEDMQQFTIEDFQITSLGMLSIEGMKAQILVSRIDEPLSKANFPPTKETFEMIPRTIMFDSLLGLLKVAKGILVFGPMGSGKTVFLEQLAEKFSNEYEIYKTACQKFIPNIALKPIYEILIQLLQIDENLTIEEKHKQIEKRLKEINITDIGTSYLAILDFLGIGEEDSLLRKMDIKSRLEIITSCIAEVIRCISHLKPTLFVIEDVENIDSSSINYLQTIMEKLSDEKVWFIFTSQRPQVNIKGLKEFELIEIDRGRIEEYIKKVTGERINFPPTTIFHVAQFLALYNEEKENFLYNQYLGETPLLEYSLPFYDLKTIIKRRIELMEEDRDFPFALASLGEKLKLKEIPGERKPESFEILSQKGFLKKISDGYQFTSPLLHEEIYNLIPNKKERHQRLADYYRRLEGYEEYATFHYQRAEDYKRTFEFLIKSAQSVFKKGAYESAIDYYLKALELARQKKEIADLETLVSINEELADIYRAIGNEKQALKHYKVVLDSYKEILKE